MKSESFLLLLIVVVLVGLPGSVSAQKYSGGAGEANNPYLISTAHDMNEIGAHPNDWDKHFLLTADINLADYTGSQFNMIGEKMADTGNPFTGVFDGNGHTITNFCYTGSEEIAVGLFEYVGSGGKIWNLSLKDVNVTHKYRYGVVGALVGHCRGIVRHSSAMGTVSGAFSSGGLVGYNDYGIISDSYVSGTVSGDGDFAGGLVGGNLGIISNCYATGSVSGGNYTGGLVGENYHGTISHCFVTCTVSGLWHYTGGLVGVNVDGTISDCYATGNVDGNHGVGGLVGYHSAKTISTCYAVGAVDGNDNTGALVGQHVTGSYNKSFWDSDINPDANGIGNAMDPNVIGKSTAEMQQESTFIHADWDFVEIWNIGENQTYPFLRQYMPSDLNHDGRVDFFDIATVASHWLEGAGE